MTELERSVEAVKEMFAQIWDEAFAPYIKIYCDAMMGDYGVPSMLATWLLFWLMSSFLLFALVVVPIFAAWGGGS